MVAIRPDQNVWEEIIVTFVSAYSAVQSKLQGNLWDGVTGTCQIAQPDKALREGKGGHLGHADCA